MSKLDFSRIISVFLLCLSLVGIAGIACFPSERVIVNVLVIVCCAIIALTEIKDLIKIRLAEKFYSQMEDIINNKEDK